jgi:NADP-reducing hydrogenase subunit HndB
MARIKSLNELSALKDKLVVERAQESRRGVTTITVGMGTCGIAVGALDVFQALDHEIKAQQLNDIVLTQTGCIGLCQHEPIIEVTVGLAPKVAYGKANPDMVKRIVREHIRAGRIVEEFVVDATPFPTI